VLGDERSCVACSTEAVFSGQRFFTCPVHRYCKMQRRASSARLEGLEADFAGHGRGVHEQRMFSDLSVTSARLSCVECWLLRGVETPPQTSYCSRKSVAALPPAGLWRVPCAVADGRKSPVRQDPVTVCRVASFTPGYVQGRRPV